MADDRADVKNVKRRFYYPPHPSNEDSEESQERRREADEFSDVPEGPYFPPNSLDISQFESKSRS